MVAREVGSLLRATVDQLPEVERQIIALRFGSGMTQEEISKVLNCSQRTVSGRLKNSLMELRKKLSVLGVAVGGVNFTSEYMASALLAEELPAEGSQRVFENILEIGLQKPTLVATRARSALTYGLPIALVASVGLMGFAYWKDLQGLVAQDRVAASVEENKLNPSLLDQSEAIDRTWNFRFEAAPKELSLFSGAWKWRKGAREGAGFMGVKPRGVTAIRLPVRCPKGAFVVDITCASLIDPKASYGLSVFRVCEENEGIYYEEAGCWLGPKIVVKNGSNVYRFYSKGAFLWKVLAGSVRNVREFKNVDAHQNIYLLLSNLAVEEISISSLTPDQFPRTMRDPRTLGLDHVFDGTKRIQLNESIKGNERQIRR